MRRGYATGLVLAALASAGIAGIAAIDDVPARMSSERLPRPTTRTAEKKARSDAKQAAKRARRAARNVPVTVDAGVGE